MVDHSGSPSAESLPGFVPFLAGRVPSALGRRKNLAPEIDRWEDEGGFVCGTAPVRDPRAVMSSSTAEKAEALASQVSLVARVLASDYAEGRVGTRHNSFQHRSRALLQMSAQLEGMSQRRAASIALEQSQ